MGWGNFNYSSHFRSFPIILAICGQTAKGQYRQAERVPDLLLCLPGLSGHWSSCCLNGCPEMAGPLSSRSYRYGHGLSYICSLPLARGPGERSKGS